MVSFLRMHCQTISNAKQSDDHQRMCILYLLTVRTDENNNKSIWGAQTHAKEKNPSQPRNSIFM